MDEYNCLICLDEVKDPRLCGQCEAIYCLLCIQAWYAQCEVDTNTSTAPVSGDSSASAALNPSVSSAVPAASTSSQTRGTSLPASSVPGLQAGAFNDQGVTTSTTGTGSSAFSRAGSASSSSSHRNRAPNAQTATGASTVTSAFTSSQAWSPSVSGSFVNSASASASRRSNAHADSVAVRVRIVQDATQRSIAQHSAIASIGASAAANSPMRPSASYASPSTSSPSTGSPVHCPRYHRCPHCRREQKLEDYSSTGYLVDLIMDMKKMKAQLDAEDRKFRRVIKFFTNLIITSRNPRKTAILLEEYMDSAITIEEFCNDSLVEPLLPVLWNHRTEWREETYDYIRTKTPKIRLQCATNEIKLPFIRIPKDIDGHNVWKMQTL